ncbi:MAG: hypothetical protein ACREJD_08170 [Phycisphaerales bacterium]
MNRNPESSRGDEDLPEEDLPDIDRAIRINELTEKAKELGLSSLQTNEDCPPEVEEAFLSNIVAYESAPLTSGIETLASRGVTLPDAASLNDEQLHAKLWEAINALAADETYLYHTDHLSDRDLYICLRDDVLQEQNPKMPKGMGWVHCIDLIDSGSDETIDIGLRYYDSEESRERWAKDFPDMVIPPHEPLPFDRDKLLPRAPDPVGMYEVSEEDDDLSEFDAEWGLADGEEPDDEGDEWKRGNPQ